MHKNKKLPSVTLFRKLNIESEHLNAVHRTKNYHSTLVSVVFSTLSNIKSQVFLQKYLMGLAE